MAKELEVQGLNINYKNINENAYISLTDIAKYKNVENPADVIIKWMSNKDSFDFYNLWEELFNANFNFAESREIKINELGLNAFTMSPAQWKKRTNAIGIVPSAGKYSHGTFAHQDIAMEFASWIDTSFKLYLIKEFQRLKAEENKQMEWSAKRELAKMNYRIHTDAIKEYIVPTLSRAQLNFVYANEADILNVAMFGKTAAAWRNENPDLKGNIRDYATIEQLLVLANMESYNSILIEQNKHQSERLQLLNEMAISQLRVLQNYSPNLLQNKN